MQDRLDHDRLASFSEDTTMAIITGHAVVESPKGCCVAHPLEVQIRGKPRQSIQGRNRKNPPEAGRQADD